MAPHAETEADPCLAYVLVVEDDVVIRATVADALRDAGLSVIEVANADDALTYIAVGERVDLVFSDVNMPGSMTGVEFASLLKQSRPDMRIILTSGNQEVEPEVAPFLHKPYRLAAVVALIFSELGLEQP